MLTLDYLKAVLNDPKLSLPDITDMDKQVIESAAGYDGIVSLVQTKKITPIIVLEHNSVGELSVRPGGFMRASQSLWIMKMVGRDADRSAVQVGCFADMKRIIGLLVKHKYDPQLKGWQPESIPYSIRNAGPNFTGYEFTLSFDEDVDLSYDGQKQHS